MSLDILKQRIKDNKLSGVFLLYGQEEFMKDYYLTQIRKTVINTPIPEFNYIKTEEKEADISNLLEFSESLPYMSEYKIIEIISPDFAKLKQTVSDDYASLIKNLPDYVILVFVSKCDELDSKELSKPLKSGGGKLLDAIKKNGLVVEFSKETDGKLLVWVKKHFEKEKIQISNEAAQLLMEMCDRSMYLLSGEIKKLLSYNNGETINAEIVKTVCCANVNYQIYELGKAFAAKNNHAVIDIYNNLIAHKIKAATIISYLSRYFSEMYLVKTAAQNGVNPLRIAKSLGLADWQLRKTLDSVRGVEKQKLKYIVTECAKTDMLTKTSPAEDETVVGTMLLKLMAYEKR